MGILGKQTLIVKCPMCKASTKVNAHPDKAAINCPRCKASVPLAYARKYTGNKPEEVTQEAPPIQREIASSGYGSESGLDRAETLPSTSKRKQRSARPATNETQFDYPDHTKGFTRYSFLIIGSIGAAALLLAIYLYWQSIVNSKTQDYLRNLRETVELTQSATANVRKLLDPQEETDAQKALNDIKGRMDFLNAVRRRLSEPDAANGEVKQLKDELSAAIKELKSAEEDVKRIKNQTAPLTVKEVTPSVSPNLGSSTLVGPPVSTNEPPKAVILKVDQQTVIITIPDITKAQWSDEFAKRFALIADDGNGKVTVKWAGDLLHLEVSPVADPARYVSKINFAKPLYYSRSDRTISIKFNPERVNNYSAEGDLLTPLLIDLKQREKLPKIFPALTKLASVKLDLSRQAEVAAVLEIIAGDTKLDNTTREQAIKLLPSWSGRESADLLIRLLDDKSVAIRMASVDALVDCKAPIAASTLASRWEKLELERVSRALIRFGSEAEPVVLPYLNNTSSIPIRVEACKVLKDIGTTVAMKPLLDVMNAKDQSPIVATAAKEAMKAILERSTK